MMSRIAVVFASKGGQTRKIAQFLEEKIQEAGLSTLLIDADRKPWPNLPSNVDGVIYGSPVYAGKFRKSLLRWVRAHHRELAAVPTALFTVTLNAADRHAAARPADDDLVRSLIDRTGFVPGHAASLAGALPYRSYPWPLRLFMRRIARAAGGDTDMSRNYEYTDWIEAERFLHDFLGADRESPYAIARRFPTESSLDSSVPVFEQLWRGSIEIGRSPREVFAALKTLPASEMRLARVLTWVRTLGAADPTPPGESFLVSAERFGNVPLPASHPLEIVAALVGRFWRRDFGIVRVPALDFARFADPGYAKVVCSYRVDAVSPTRSLVTAEMRVHSTSEEARRKFARYWLLLGMGIRLYMRSSLAALRRRAERAPADELPELPQARTG